MSKESPTSYKVTEDGKIIQKDSRSHSQTKNFNVAKRRRGYMSKTTNSFQFGLKGKSQWVGEDILIFKGIETFYFSAVAVGRVTVIEISKQDMISKLPQQCLKLLEKSSLK